MPKKKSFLSFIFTTVLLLAMVTPMVSAATEEQAPQEQAAAAAAASTGLQSYVDAMQPGWNLGNSLDATGADETSWGNPAVTQALIKKIAAQGYKSIRIPVTWDVHT